MNEGRLAAHRARAAGVASRVLVGNASAILAARELKRILFSPGCDLEDFDQRAFIGIDSQTDALPVGPELDAELVPRPRYARSDRSALAAERGNTSAAPMRQRSQRVKETS